LSSDRSSQWAAGTPEAIFAPVLDPTTVSYARGDYAPRRTGLSNQGLVGPGLFGELRSPIIPRSWVTETSWKISGSSVSKRKNERIRLTQDDLAEPGFVLTNHPDVNVFELAEQSVVARAAVGSWLGNYLAEVYEPELEQASQIALGETPLLVSSFARLVRHGCRPEQPLLDALHLRRREMLTERADAVMLVDLEILIENWLPHRDADEYWQQMHGATQLDEVASALALRLLRDTARTSPTAAEILRRRGWGRPKCTLEQLGEERGVTRERVRQIFIPIERRIGERRWPISNRIEAGIRQIIAPNDLNDGEDDLLNEFGDDWTISAVVDLLEALGRIEVAARVKAASEARDHGIGNAIRSIVRRHRSALGFLDLTVLKNDQAIMATGRDPVELVRKVYSRVVVVDDFALATSDPTSTAERIAAQQFFVTPAISLSEFREGFVRVARKRGQPVPPGVAQLIALLTAAGAVTSSGSTVTGPPGELAEGTLHRWLFDQLESADGGVLHVESLVRLAIRDQKNISSLTNYITYEPFVRRIIGTGLVRLVGRTISGADQAIASRIAEAQRSQTRIVAAPHERGHAIDLTAGTSLFTSGVLQLPSDLRAIWPKPGPTPRCACEHGFESHFDVGRTGTTTGWQSLLSHLALSHGLLDGGRIRMVLDGRDLYIEGVASA
jgi:hypothetical protein